MDPHEKISIVVRMLNSVSRSDTTKVTVAEYYEYSWQELMMNLIDLLQSIDPSFNQQAIKQDVAQAIQEILRSLSMIGYKPSQEVNDQILNVMTIEEAMRCQEDIYTDIFHYLLSNFEDNKEAFYLNSFISPVYIADSKMQLDSEIINLSKDFDSYVTQFLDLKAHHSKLKQEYMAVENIKRDYVSKEETKNLLESRLQDMRDKYNGDSNKRPDILALCKEVTNQDVIKQKLLTQNERHLKEIENVRRDIFSLQSEIEDIKQLLNDCKHMSTERELIVKLESEIDKHLYRIEKVYKPDLNDLESLLDEIAIIENNEEVDSTINDHQTMMMRNYTNSKQTNPVIDEEELNKRIETVEDKIDASEKILKDLLNVDKNSDNEIIERTDDEVDNQTMDEEFDSEDQCDPVMDRGNVNSQLAQLIRRKDELMREFQQLSGAYIESNEQLDAIRQINMIKLPREFQNLAEFCEQPIESLVRQAKQKYDDCIEEKKELEMKIAQFEQRYRELAQSFRDLEQLKMNPMEQKFNIVGYFDRIRCSTKQPDNTNGTSGGDNKRIDLDIDCTIDENGVVDWNSVIVDPERIRAQVNQFQAEIEKKKANLEVTILANLKSEHKSCQASLMKLRQPYDEQMNPLKAKLFELEAIKQKLDGRIAELKSSIESKEYLIKVQEDAIANNNNSSSNYFNMATLNVNNLERQKKMWLTIEAWLKVVVEY